MPEFLVHAAAHRSVDRSVSACAQPGPLRRSTRGLQRLRLRGLRFRRFAGPIAAALLLAWVPGCVAIEAVAGIFGPRPNNGPVVEMRYAGLENQRVAVVASIDPALARQQPELGLALEALLADRLARHVPGIGVLPPEQTRDWLTANPWWETIPPGGVTRGLGVQRLVRIEVAGFRTRQNGNAAVLEGSLDTALQVYALPGTGGDAIGSFGNGDPDRPVFADRVVVRHPDDSELGIPNVQPSSDPGFEGVSTPSGPDEAAIARTLLASWIRRAGPIFYDQEAAQERDRERAKEKAASRALPTGGPA